MRPQDLRLPGAVDLSALKRPAATPGATGQPGGSGAPSSLVIDVTEATFETDVLLRSRDVPVVIDFWATWCEPCKQLSPVLERLVAADGGRWLLAKVDVDAESRLGQAFQVQSIPSVVAVVAGQPVPLFQGALPEGQVRQVLDELLRVAAANGVTGTVTVGEDQAGTPAEAPGDPLREQAWAAVDSGDVTAALAAYRAVLDAYPGDPEAVSSIARFELLERTRDVDVAAARKAAADAPADVDAGIVVADLDMANGHVDDAVDRLVALVRDTSDGDRDRARAALLALFAVLDPDDARLARGRRALANALF